MTVERWTDDRLDQLADDVRGNTTAITDLRTTAELLLQTVTIYQTNFETMQNNFNVVIARIDRMQSEIRGLQLENRRMLQEMRGLPPDEPDEPAQ